MNAITYVAAIMGVIAGAATAGMFYKPRYEEAIERIKSLAEGNDALINMLHSRERLNRALLKELAELQASAAATQALTEEPLTMEKMNAWMDKLPKLSKEALKTLEKLPIVDLSLPPYQCGCFLPGAEKTRSMTWKWS